MSAIAQQAASLPYPDFAGWLARQPLPKQYQYQREAGFGVLDGLDAQHARAEALGLKPDAAPALILYLHHRGRAWIGKPSIRLEFNSNEQALQTAARFVDAGAPAGVVKSGNRGAARREMEAQLNELADQSRKEAAATPAPGKGKAGAVLDAEYQAVKLLLSNGQPITAQQATRYPDLVKQFSEFYDSLGLTMVSDAATKPAPAAALPADGSVVLVPVKDIKTDKRLFQNREADFSEESVQRILQAVAAGTFRWEVLDPVVLWRKPGTADVYSLSGHSRKEAFRRLAVQGARVDGRGFEAIPAKITECSQAEAVEIARNSNNLSTKETELERAAYYRGLRAEGKSKKEIDAAAAGYEGKNKTFILNLSYLAANGQAVQALASFADAADGSGKEVVRTLADWTGEARRRYPQLTDSHENETFGWLRTAYGSKAGQLRNKQEFLQRLDTTISRATTFGQFAQDQPLNLANRTGKSSVEQEYDEQLATARREHQDAEKVLADKRKELVARKASDADLARILPTYEAAVMRSLKELNRISALKYSVQDAARNQASLFGLKRLYAWPEPTTHLISGLKGEVKVKGEKVEELNIPEIKVTYRKRRFDKDLALNTSKDIADLFRKVWDKGALDVQESFYALFLTGSGVLLGYYRHTVGTTGSVQIDFKLLLGAALKSLAATVFVAHNHPSGVLTPSDADKEFTRKLDKACTTVGITLMDSQIITRTGYVSLYDLGLLG